MNRLGRHPGLLGLALLLGCSRDRDGSGDGLHPLVRTAQAGVFFGGQVSERTEIPFELDETRQTQGFRLTFTEPLPRAATVQWELDVPASAEGAQRAGSSSRTKRTMTAVVPTGARDFEQRIALSPTDHTGTWNLRVRFDSVPVLDRPFRLFVAARRDRDD
jgi:hypothetical protein